MGITHKLNVRLSIMSKFTSEIANKVWVPASGGVNYRVLGIQVTIPVIFISIYS